MRRLPENRAYPLNIRTGSSTEKLYAKTEYVTLQKWLWDLLVKESK